MICFGDENASACTLAILKIETVRVQASPLPLLELNNKCLYKHT